MYISVYQALIFATKLMIKTLVFAADTDNHK